MHAVLSCVLRVFLRQVFGLTGDCVLNTLRSMGLITVR